MTHLQHQLALRLDDVRRVDLCAGQTTRTRALIRSNAGNPHVLAVPHNRTPAYDLSNTDFVTTLRRRLRLRLSPSPFDGANGAGVLCDGCNKLDCADVYGDSQLSCNARMPITRLVHDPLTERIADLTRMCGLRVTVEPAPANPRVYLYHLIPAHEQTGRLHGARPARERWCPLRRHGGDDGDVQVARGRRSDR